MTAAVPTDTKRTRSSCAECGRETWHYLRHETSREDSDAEGWWSHEQSQFLECCGCGATSVRKIVEDASMSGPDDMTATLFPPRLPRRRPAWFWRVDTRFQALLKEVYESLGTGALALPVMGARTILDLVIRDKVGDQGNFKEGLDELEAKGLLSKHDRSLLEAAIEAGSAAAHRGFTPAEQDVASVIEIVEHLLNSQYVLKVAAENLKAKTPPRRPKP